MSKRHARVEVPAPGTTSAAERQTALLRQAADYAKENAVRDRLSADVAAGRLTEDVARHGIQYG